VNRHDITDRRIFITGGAGFIGSLLIERLVGGNEITAYDNLSRNALATRGDLGSHPNLTLVEGDVLDAEALHDALRGYDLVVHCAAIAGIDTVVRSPVRTMQVNMLGSLNVLEAARSVGSVERVVCFSTSEVFGARAFNVVESDGASVGEPGEPRWTYAVSKLAEEHLAAAFHSEHGLPTTVLRPFNVYGPGQVGEGAIRNFIDRALRGEDLRVRRPGNQIRSWCFVEDMVDAVLLALVRSEAVGESFNIGNERTATTTVELARTIVRLADSTSAVTYIDAAGADVEIRIPRTTKARDMLGFEASVDLDEGIARTIDWVRKAGA
jgi:UDP-glucose 4-epimerase